jgi:short-subunit dehydrogenase
MPAESRRVAAVTGASSGIGRAFAKRLAAAEHDLILIARSQDRLESTAAELRERHGGEVRVLPADLGDALALAGVEAELRADPPHLLVNSAGFGTSGAFADLDIEHETELLRVNVIALVRLTRACLPGMLERGSGAIVNVSSLAGEVPSGFNAIYGGSKAFVSSFSQALYEELRDSPVIVQCLLPGLTDTAWAQTAGIDTSNTPSIAISDPDDVAAASLAALERRAAVCIPGAPNRVLAFVQRVVPRAWMRRATARATKGSLARKDS